MGLDEVLVSSTVSGFLVGSLCTPFDVVKNYWQFNPAVASRRTSLSAARVAQLLYRQQGLAAFWRGVLPAYCTIIPSNIIFFHAYERRSPEESAAWAGIKARAAAVVATAPMELLRTRMQAAMDCGSPSCSSCFPGRADAGSETDTTRRRERTTRGSSGSRGSQNSGADNNSSTSNQDDSQRRRSSSSRHRDNGSNSGTSRSSNFRSSSAEAAAPGRQTARGGGAFAADAAAADPSRQPVPSSSLPGQQGSSRSGGASLGNASVSSSGRSGGGSGGVSSSLSSSSSSSAVGSSTGNSSRSRSRWVSTCAKNIFWRGRAAWTSRAAADLVAAETRSCRRGMLREAFLQVVQRGGVLSLWSGVLPTLIRDLPFSAIYWQVTATIKSYAERAYRRHPGVAAGGAQTTAAAEEAAAAQRRERATAARGGRRGEAEEGEGAAAREGSVGAGGGALSRGAALPGAGTTARHAEGTTALHPGCSSSFCKPETARSSAAGFVSPGSRAAAAAAADLPASASSSPLPVLAAAGSTLSTAAAAGAGPTAAGPAACSPHLPAAAAAGFRASAPSLRSVPAARSSDRSSSSRDDGSGMPVWEEGSSNSNSHASPGDSGQPAVAATNFFANGSSSRDSSPPGWSCNSSNTTVGADVGASPSSPSLSPSSPSPSSSPAAPFCLPSAHSSSYTSADGSTGNNRTSSRSENRGSRSEREEEEEEEATGGFFSSALFHSVVLPFFSGAAASAVACVVTHPFDVLKTNIQASALLYDTRLRREEGFLHILSRSAPQVARTVYEQQGIRGFTIGLTPRLLKIVPSCAVLMASYEITKFVCGQSLLDSM